MATRTEWPTEVPVLTESDFCRGDINGPNGKRCLLGWQIAVFGSCMNSEANRAVNKAIREEMRQCDGCFVTGGVVLFNDNPHRSLREVAKLWNRCMARLGYVVGQDPEVLKALRAKGRRKKVEQKQ